MALEISDVGKVLSFFTKDSTWVIRDDTFRGKEKLRRYLMWMAHMMQDVTITKSVDWDYRAGV